MKLYATCMHFVSLLSLSLFSIIVVAQEEVLDSFNQQDGDLGVDWSGSRAGYRISDNQLAVDKGGDVYWNVEFGSDQHVYVTLTAINLEADEIDLLLKSQSNTIWSEGVLEVWYKPDDERIQIVTYSDGWVQHGADIPATFADGDRFGARARPDGVVEVYQNDDLLAVQDVSTWPHAEAEGYIGLWMIGAEDTVLDDFGGGESAAAFMSDAISTSTAAPKPTLTPDPTPMQAAVLDDFDRANGALGSNWSGQMGGYRIVNNQIEVRGDGDIYWGWEAFGDDQHVFVTLTAIDLEADEIDLLLKSQSNTTWGEGVLEVWYTPEDQRVQIVTYTQETGWVQHGADIPVIFAEGDRFGARARPDGVVELRQNGNLIASRDISDWPYAKEGGYIGLWMINASSTVLDNFGGGDW